MRLDTFTEVIAAGQTHDFELGTAPDYIKVTALDTGASGSATAIPVFPGGNANHTEASVSNNTVTIDVPRAEILRVEAVTADQEVLVTTYKEA